ncbi:MAG: leucine-rich repeat domain-containing protein, partial [Synergistaceae bacterium]|nr:leucine-rich repeat domain-containing protein [Synergistaceae bacterium]
MYRPRFVPIVFLFLAVALLFPVAASAGLDYSDSGTAITITGIGDYNLTANSGVLTIPDMIDDQRVTGIGDRAFYRLSDITSVIGGANLKDIGAEAFYQCDGLESVNLPVAKDIGDWAFYYCGDLRSVSLPAAENIG